MQAKQVRRRVKGQSTAMADRKRPGELPKKVVERLAEARPQVPFKPQLRILIFFLQNQLKHKQKKKSSHLMTTDGMLLGVKQTPRVAELLWVLGTQ